MQTGDLQELLVEMPPHVNEEREGGDPRPLIPSTLYLLLGLPDRCHRHRSDWVRVAINGRFVQMPELEQTILAGFRQTVPRDRFPLCLVHLQVPPAQIDWNRHPAKAEIYLHHLADWRERVASAINQALRLSPINLTNTLYSQRVGTLLKTAEAEAGYGARSIQEPGAEGQGNRGAGEAGEQEDKGTPNSSLIPHPSSLIPSPLKAIAQIHNTYILAEHPAGIWLIEQHIAHERVLYEQLCDRWQLVPLEPPVILHQLSVARWSSCNAWN